MPKTITIQGLIEQVYYITLFFNKLTIKTISILHFRTTLSDSGEEMRPANLSKFAVKYDFLSANNHSFIFELYNSPTISITYYIIIYLCFIALNITQNCIFKPSSTTKIIKKPSTKQKSLAPTLFLQHKFNKKRTLPEKNRTTAPQPMTGDAHITFSENSQSAPITETNRTKITLSAIMTPFVTQKSGIFVTSCAKTALASYLL